MRILLVEGSHTLQRSLSAGLRNSGYSVDQAFDGQQAQHIVACDAYDVIVLDIMISKIDGLSVLEKLRRDKKGTHVIILSTRDTAEDRIKGLDIGADDYLVKPFSFEELLSRIRALTRRALSSGEEHISSLLQLDDIVINTALRTTLVSGKEANLTPNEFKILELLVRREGQVYGPDQLIERLYATENPVTRNAIEVHISSLRRKLRKAGADNVVKTKSGCGYYIVKKAS